MNSNQNIFSVFSFFLSVEDLANLFGIIHLKSMVQTGVNSDGSRVEGASRLTTLASLGTLISVSLLKQSDVDTTRIIVRTTKSLC